MVATDSSLSRWHETLVVWVVFAVFVVVRFPAMRRGAAPYYEEGATYLRFALSHGWWDALWQSHVGYLAFWSNLTGVVEATVPWAWVPAVSVVLGLVAPTWVVAVLARASVPLWCRLVAVAGVVWTSTMAREWYSPIHAQFWFTLAVLVSLGAPPTRRWQRVADVVLAVVAGLAGAVSLAAVPVVIVAAAVDREYRRHYGLVAAVLAVVGGLNAVSGAGRDVAMPAGRLAYFVVVKALWQPLTGEWGGDAAQDWYGWNGMAATVGWLTVVAASAALLWWATQGRWRVVALGGLWVSAVMLWYSVPPAAAMVSPDVGGRYAVAGVLSILCGALFGARTPPVRVGAVAVVSFAILQGVVVEPDNDRGGVHVDAFRADLAAAGPGGASVRIEPGTCRIATNPEQQRVGFAVDDGLTSTSVTVSPADASADAPPVGIFVVVQRSGVGYAALDSTGVLQDVDGFFFGGRPDDNSQPGWCFFGASPPAAAVSRAGERAVIDIAADGVNGPVFVGAGSSFADALAANTFERLHDPP